MTDNHISTVESHLLYDVNALLGETEPSRILAIRDTAAKTAQILLALYAMKDRK